MNITKKQVAQYVKTKLATDARWACRAIVLVYNKQTASEQCANVTIDANGVGFSGCDAEFMSSLAQQILKGRNLSPKQLLYAHKRISRYWKQVLTAIPADKLESLKSTIAAQCAVIKPTVELTPTMPNYENSEIAQLARVA